jgi:hypothetical protein
MGHFSARLCCGHGCDGIKEVELIRATGVAYLFGGYVICGILHKALKLEALKGLNTQSTEQRHR